MFLRRLLIIHDNQESLDKETFKNYSNNGSVSPVACSPTELTTMIDYHFPGSEGSMVVSY